MVLIEGVSNEVLLAFIVTILLALVTIFYVITSSSGRSRLPNEDVADIPVGNPPVETNESTPQPVVNGDTGNKHQSVSGENPNDRQDQDVCNNDNYNSHSGSSQSSSTFTENLRRRAGNDRGGDNEGNEPSQEQTITVKVKHNENIRSFNVSRNCTVLELKRLAFPNEMNSGKRVRFVFAGQLLRNDNDALTTYSVQNNTVVHCVITDPPQQTQPDAEENEEDLDLSRFLIPLLTAGLILSWYGLITYKHIFTGSSIAILMFLTSLYFILVYVTTVQ